MAYKFPTVGEYSIRQAQELLELSDVQLDLCVQQRWLRLALRNTVIPYPHPGNGYYAALPFAHAEHLPDELQEQIDLLRPLPDYLYYAGEHVPTGAVVFDDFSEGRFLLMSVHRLPKKPYHAPEGPPIYARSDINPNAETELKVMHVGHRNLAWGILGERRIELDAHKFLRSYMVVTREELERFRNKFARDEQQKAVTLEPIIFDEEGSADMKPHQKATAARTKEKEKRQAAVKKIMDESNLELSNWAWAKHIHEIIARDPKKWRMARAPAVRTIQNDMTEIKKGRS